MFDGDSRVLGIRNRLPAGLGLAAELGEDFPMAAAWLDHVSPRMGEEGIDHGQGLREGSRAIRKGRLGHYSDKSTGSKGSQAEWIVSPDDCFQSRSEIRMMFLIFPVRVDQDVDVEEDHL